MKQFSGFAPHERDHRADELRQGSGIGQCRPAHQRRSDAARPGEHVDLCEQV